MFWTLAIISIIASLSAIGLSLAIIGDKANDL